MIRYWQILFHETKSFYDHPVQREALDHDRARRLSSAEGRYRSCTDANTFDASGIAHSGRCSHASTTRPCERALATRQSTGRGFHKYSAGVPIDADWTIF